MHRIGQQGGTGTTPKREKSETNSVTTSTPIEQWSGNGPLPCSVYMCQMAVDIMSLTCLLGDVRFEVKVVLFHKDPGYAAHLCLTQYQLS